MVDWPVYAAPQEDKQEMTKKINDILEAAKKTKAAELQQLSVPPKLTPWRKLQQEQKKAKAAPEPTPFPPPGLPPRQLLGPAPPPGPPPRQLLGPAPPPGPPPSQLLGPAPPPGPPPGAKRRRLSFVGLSSAAAANGAKFAVAERARVAAAEGARPLSKSCMIIVAPKPMSMTAKASRTAAQAARQVSQKSSSSWEPATSKAPAVKTLKMRGSVTQNPDG